MIARMALSFDDGLIEQFGWAKELHHRGIVGTFYINPATVGFRGMLNMGQLRKMHDEMHHIIANHLWNHESPRHGATLVVAIKSLIKTSDWLKEMGFGDGCDLLALPCGSGGGEWLENEVLELAKYCSQIRDVTTTGVNNLDARKYIGACETTVFPHVEDKIILRYFHGYHSTSNDEFISFLDSLTNVKVISMREIADGKVN